MELGVALASSTDSWQVVKRAEELGFSNAWFYDTQLLNPDVFVCMALAAEHTRRIGLGTGVLIPSNRIAPVAANGLASLNKLAPGRIRFGVGTGFTGRRTMGLGPIPRAELRRYVAEVQALLRGETIAVELEGRPRKLRFLNPDLGLIDIEHEIPLAISAMGPKMRRLAAQLGAWWLDFTGHAEQAEADMADMKQAWREAGRPESELRASVFALGCVLEAGEPADSPRARAQAGPLVVVALHSMVESEQFGELIGRAPAALREALRAYRAIYETYEPPDARYLTLHRGHLMFLRPEEEPFVTAEALRSFTLTGTAEELAERVRALAALGYTELVIQVVPGHESALEDWARVFERV